MAETIRPNPKQEKFLATKADIAVYGGAAGGGKSYALLMECLRHAPRVKGFSAVLFRRTSEQVRMQGGLWSTSLELFAPAGGRPREHTLDWRWDNGGTVVFRGLQYESDKLEYQGSQICCQGYDELTHFTESQFFYMLSRNRSTCGVRPYVRATTNPDANSWVKPFLGPWLNSSHDMAAEEGELRYMRRVGGELKWSKEPVEKGKSVTFISANVFDNKVLMDADPDYLANLEALNVVDRRRLLYGDWDIVESGNFFRRDWFKVTADPPKVIKSVRFWDLAATESKPGKDPDWTVGVKIGITADNELVIEDVQRMRETPLNVEKRIRAAAEQDGRQVPIEMEQEPGASGVIVIDHYLRSVLFGFLFRGRKTTGDKAERAKPLSAFAEKGHVYLKQAAWNDAFLNELCAFPLPDVHDDQVDAASGASVHFLLPTKQIKMEFF